MDAEHGQGQVLHQFVEQDFPPVKPEVADPVHRDNRMMNAMNFPEPTRAVKEVVDQVLDEIGGNENGWDLYPQGRG